MESKAIFKVEIENRIDQRVELMLEPEGSDFWMEPGEAVVVNCEAPAGTEIPFVVQVTDDGISVWSNYGPGWVSDRAGEDLDIGHNRPDGAYPELDESSASTERRRRWPWRLFS
ncbi:hypothetical protein P3T27_007768 [Kitasatospora sp. MAA19]|uniref:hypothetical protein n=1 Tax=Kitasatospora sp. MAA19 TaxID=3035090 RepID=UPI0024761831|nr:hypothetical protein [Kitasatospora sp. MAA19]MDH6711016.1 hypothetical protein [Kitasatospora sp. MAA19]